MIRLVRLMWLMGACALIACGTSHPPAGCSEASCGTGAACMTTERFPEGTCVERCDRAIVGHRCENGAWCAPWMGDDVCRAGGLAREGSTTVVGSDCAFGLLPRRHYDEEPLRRTCEPVCNTDADCRPGERCQYTGGSCDVPCEGPGSTPCTPPNRCVDGFCVNERRFARIDCDGDGVITLTGCLPPDCDCFPWGECDPEAIGGCAHPEPGTE